MPVDIDILNNPFVILWRRLGRLSGPRAISCDIHLRLICSRVAMIFARSRNFWDIVMLKQQ
jgi:hypothetical protein